MSLVDDKTRPRREQGSQAAQAAAQASGGNLIPSLDDEPSDAPPAYGDLPDQVQFSQPGIDAGAVITDDGRIDININTKTRRLADLLGPAIAKQISVPIKHSLPPAYIPASLGGLPGQTPPPQLNVVIQIVGSRGDVQPFVALGKVLRETYKHRVRIATHPTFQGFVEENGLEFFSIGGDPAELMAFMVKHPGLMPGFDAIKSGEVSKRRRGIAQMLLGCWRSCIEAGNGLGPPPKFDNKNEPVDVSAGMPGDTSQEPFVADAIIANPPSFAHIHVAEKLGIPLHMMFTMPWSPTKAFPHPLANIKSSNADDVMTNYLTYTLVEMMTWHGLGDIINRFRETALDLSPLSAIWAPGLLSRLRVSYTYCWSPALIPKPNDWSNHIDISGFFFLNLASSYTPDPELAAFLAAGPPPVYIGFGSIVVDDPNALTKKIFDAVRIAGVRALVSKGWGGIGADELGIPEGVYMLGNVPHDWLFQRVSAVVHHGGAGTTAAGIKAGKPTLVVPFFGDQPFWGAMIARAKAGPEPIPNKDLTTENLAEGLKFCLLPNTIAQAEQLGQKISQEQGTDVGGKSFHDHLNVENLRCAVAPSRTAVWRVKKSDVRLSALAGAVLADRGLLEYTDLKLHRPVEYNTDDQPPDPISACAFSLVSSASGIGMEIADMPRDLFKSKQKNKAKDEVQLPRQENRPQEDKVLSDTASSSASPSATGLDRKDTGLTSTSSGLSNASQQSLASDSTIMSTSRQGSRTDRAAETLSPAPASSGQAGQAPAGFDIEAAMNTGKGVGRIVSHGVKSPMNFCLGCAKGFRNIPRLYNDDTVRPIEKVTNIQSGIRIAGKEFGYGLYDGVSGLVTQPLRAAEKEAAAGGFMRGAGGLVKGFGKGIGGVITKPAAGFWGIPAYLMQGVHAEVHKLFTKNVQNYITMSRITQGKNDFSHATAEEREDIIKRWNNIKIELRNAPSTKRKTAGIQKSEQRGTPTAEAPGVATSSGSISSTTSLPLTSGGSISSGPSTAEDAEFESAIVAAVKQTSQGNADEDAAIEAAIRQSVMEVRQHGAFPNMVPDESAKLSEKDATIFEDSEYKITDEEYQELIEKAIQQSITRQESGTGNHDGTEPGHYSGLGSSGQTQHDEDDDADLKRAIEESRQPTGPSSGGGQQDEEEYEKAIAASREEHKQQEHQKTEEEIVMEYVMKQSMAEEELRRQAGKGKGKNERQGAGDDEDDEDLRRALEESLKMKGGGGGGPSGR